jgi:gliding motility-associated-like protein
VGFIFDKAGGCSPLIVRFTNQTFGASASAAYLWDLGNGNTSAVKDAQAVYTDEGSYTVTLTVTDRGAVATASQTVTVYPHSKPDFSYTPNSVCGPQPISFTGTAGFTGNGSGSIIKWLWDFGDGSTAQTGNATTQHTYPTTFSGPASLTVTNNYGCTDTVSLPVSVTVLTPATSAFTSDKQVLCLVTDPVQFTSNSSGPGPLTYDWDFGDGTTATLANPGHSYAQKGNYTVKLTTTTSEGCQATSSQVNFLNVANYSTDFDVPPAAVCQNTGFTFADRSSPLAGSRVWSIDGAPVAYYTPLQYTFSTPGTHTVQLDNLFGSCPQSQSKTFVVNPIPAVVPFDEDITQDCSGVSVQFTDKTPDAATWSWNFNTYQYGSNDINSPSTTITQTFPYNQAFTIRLTVTNANSCTNTVFGQVYVNKPSITIYETSSTSNTSCATPLTKSYAIQNFSLLQSWHWDFGDGSPASTDAAPTHTYTVSGMPTLYYTDLNGCSGSVTYSPVTITNPFSLDFSATATTVCLGTTVTFTSPSLAASGATSISWSYGDGSITSDPYYSYRSAGTYSVTLTARNAGGCQNSITKTDYITVLPAPGTYGTHTNTCDGDRGLVTFTYTPGTATSIVWQFGDGGTMTTGPGTTQVQHTYATTGTYYPEVKASNSQCSNSNSDRVLVLKQQHPKLTASSPFACMGGTLDVQLAMERNPYEVNSGYDDDYTPQFLYGDGTPFTGTVSYTTYYQPYSNGAFHWTLSGFTAGKSGLQVATKSFGFGCTDVSNTIPLTIRGSATAAFTVMSDDHCYQSPVILKDASTPGVNNSILSGYWDFGDGQTASQVGGTLSHTYSDPGQYAVRLTVTDAAGCTISSGANINYVSVNGPKVSFSPSGTNVNLNTTVYFYNTTNYYGTTNVVWTWDFGDGSGASDFSPYHTYTVPGVYTVQLQARDASNPNTCVGSVVATITVKNFNSHFQVAPSYVGTAGCPPVLAQFYNTSSNYTSVSWDFGDGWTAGNVNAPSHVYTSAGRYIVKLFVQGYNGLTSTYIDSVFVRRPVAELSSATSLICLGQAAAYQATATGAKTYTWDFGDGSVGAGLYPDSVTTHVYASAGQYAARLIVTDTFGCSMAAGKAVNLQVHGLPTVMVDPPSTYLCDNSQMKLTASGASTYVWTPATGLDRADIAAPVAAPTVSTVYQVLGTDDAGCQNSTSVTVAVVSKQKVTVAPDSTSVCDGQTIQLVAKGADIYYWLDDVVGSDNAGVVTARPSASGIYTVIGRDVHECFTDTALIRVTVLPAPTVNGGLDVEVLAGNSVLLSATGSADVTEWKWTPADYLSCTSCSQPVSSPKKPEEYIVMVKNAEGCMAADTVEAKILCVELNVRIPDAFSPNGDGKNDRFVVLGIGEVKHLVIYDRWGAKVWERNNFYPADAWSCWDGTAHGQPAPVGTYVYYVEMECPAGGVFGRKGTVVLVR